MAVVRFVDCHFRAIGFFCCGVGRSIPFCLRLSTPNGELRLVKNYYLGYLETAVFSLLMVLGPIGAVVSSAIICDQGTQSILRAHDEQYNASARVIC